MLCKSVCPKSAIKFSDESGFYRPIIGDSCVKCHLCVKMCPSNNRETIHSELNAKPSRSYVAWNKNDLEHVSSASGGVALLLMKHVIQEGGFAVGCWFNNNSQRVEHKIFETLDDLSLAKGSKYVNSYKGEIYKEVINLLKTKKGVFIGVPCEVSAMQQLLKKYINLNNRLYLVDLLCRGGASPLCFKEHMKKVAINRKIDKVVFRGDKYDCQLSLYKNNKLIYLDGQFSDPYFKYFMRHTLYQPACFECNYSGANRVGDITLGDFWGLDPEVEKKSSVQGTNMVLVNNVIGQELFDNIQDETYYEERPIGEAINGNSTLHNSTKKEDEYEKLWNLIHEFGFHKAIKKVYGLDSNKRFFKAKIKLEIKRFLRKL